MILNTRSLISGLLILLISPYSSTVAADEMDYSSLSCQQLYALASQLEPATQRFRSPLYNEKTRTISTAIGTVTSIGYYYFGFDISRSFYEDYRSHQTLGELDLVRRLMAQQYCFQQF